MAKLTLTRETLEKCLSDAYLNYQTIYQSAIEDYNLVRNREDQIQQSTSESDDDDDDDEKKSSINSLTVYKDKITTEKLTLALNAAKGFDNLLKIMAVMNKNQPEKEDDKKQTNTGTLTEEMKQQIKELQAKAKKGE